MDVGYSDPGMGLPYTVNINITEIYLVVRLVRLVHDFGQMPSLQKLPSCGHEENNVAATKLDHVDR